MGLLKCILHSLFVVLWLGGDTMTLQQQTHKALKAIGIPISVFCRRIGISDTAYYRWQNSDLRLSDDTTNRIKEYISKLSKIF